MYTLVGLRLDGQHRVNAIGGGARGAQQRTSTCATGSGYTRHGIVIRVHAMLLESAAHLH